MYSQPMSLHYYFPSPPFLLSRVVMILKENIFYDLFPPISTVSNLSHLHKRGYTARMIQSRLQAVAQTHQSGRHPSFHGMELYQVCEIPIHLSIVMGAIGVLAMQQLKSTCLILAGDRTFMCEIYMGSHSPGIFVA